MSMQFQGSAVVFGTQLYPTAATAKITKTPIIPDIVWGSGWKVNYATGQQRPGWSVSFPTYAGSLTALKSQTLSIPDANKINTTGQSVTISNGGTGITFSNAVTESASLRVDTLNNSVIEMTINGVAQTASIGASVPGTALLSALVPAYTANINTSGAFSALSSQIVSLDVTASHNPFWLFTADGQFYPTAIQLGLTVVTGTMTFYSAGGIGVGTGAEFALTMTSLAGNLNINHAVVTDISNDITGPNNKPMCILTFEAVGDSGTPPIS